MNYNYAVECSGVTRLFKNKTAVQDLKLQVYGGEIFGLLGHNGAGKTTTIRMLLGLLKPSYGTIKVLGYMVPNQSDLVRARAGTLLENHGLYLNINAWDNLNYYSRIYRLNTEEGKNRIIYLLKLVDLWEYRKERVGIWSKGMKQRLALARALIGKPDILFLDEPFSGLDPQSVKTIRDLLLHLSSQEHCTIVLSSHNLNEIERICNRVGIMHMGQLKAVGKPSALLENSASQTKIVGKGIKESVINILKADINGIYDVFLEMPDTIIVNWQANEKVNEVVQVLINHGVVVESVDSSTKTLEDAYMAIYERSNNND